MYFFRGGLSMDERQREQVKMGKKSLPHGGNTKESRGINLQLVPFHRSSSIDLSFKRFIIAPASTASTSATRSSLFSLIRLIFQPGYAVPLNPPPHLRSWLGSNYFVKSGNA